MKNPISLILILAAILGIIWSVMEKNLNAPIPNSTTFLGGQLQYFGLWTILAYLSVMIDRTRLKNELDKMEKQNANHC